MFKNLTINLLSQVLYFKTLLKVINKIPIGSIRMMNLVEIIKTQDVRYTSFAKSNIADNPRYWIVYIFLGETLYLPHKSVFWNFLVSEMNANKCL